MKGKACLLLLPVAAFAACRPVTGGKPASYTADSARVFHLIDEGNKAYAQKESYESFARSLKYYDSAGAIADRTGDTLLMAEAIFAKGRVYDAWNRAPRKTIELFSKAAAYFSRLPARHSRYLYVEHLVAHAYDKIQDSTGATTVLRNLGSELSGADTSLLRTLPFTAEMALIATEVRAYPLADSILRRLTRRAWIANDSETYDYLNHYYLTQSRLDAYWRAPAHSYYLDSLQGVYDASRKQPDRLYYSRELASIYGATGQYQLSSKYYHISHQIDDSLNNLRDVGNMQLALQQSELLAEQRKTAYDEAVRTGRLRLIWLLSGLLAIITLFSFYFYRNARKARTQAKKLTLANSELDDKITQVELLNKEIQHRVKNNLYMLYSLLQMQERKTDNEEVIEALQAARLRVESVAALHNQLLAGKGSLNLAEYTQGLISSVVACLSNDIKVVTHIATDEVKIAEDSYFELSLILNEWVTNSIKYAATAKGMLEINVSIKDELGQVCIEYRDSGNGGDLPPGKPGLGAQIIHLLSLQMGADLKTVGNNPYHYQLCMPHGK